METGAVVRLAPYTEDADLVAGLDQSIGVFLDRKRKNEDERAELCDKLSLLGQIRRRLEQLESETARLKRYESENPRLEREAKRAKADLAKELTQKAAKLQVSLRIATIVIARHSAATSRTPMWISINCMVEDRNHCVQCAYCA